MIKIIIEDIKKAIAEAKEYLIKYFKRFHNFMANL